MKRETIWKTSVQTTAEAEDAVSELLAALVALGPSAYTDAESGVTTVSAYSTTAPKNLSATKTALRRGLAEIRKAGLQLGLGRITIRKLPRENWADSWKRHFPPLEIGNALLVKPSWSNRRPQKGQAVIILDPGLSFGTGQHPTTEYCLRELARGRDIALRCPRPHPAGETDLKGVHLSKPRIPRLHGAVTSQRDVPTFLDMGTGSGILAIAAAKLGYAPVHAFDFDPQCVRVARANARLNRVTNKLRITRADLTKLPRRSAQRYDVICANLLANLLIAERVRILARLKPQGVLVVAGILKREFHEVQQAYEAAGMTLVASKAQKEWRSGTFLARKK
jgi:ribosomal protein L11 methyltransferase